MSTRRFFVLDNTAPSSEIPHILGLVVEKKRAPLDNFSPSKRASSIPPHSPSDIIPSHVSSTSPHSPSDIISSHASSTPPHSPSDIIPGLLPTPISRGVKSEQLTVSKKHGVGAALGAILGFKVSEGSFESVVLTTEEVKEYSLQNAPDYFYELMENEFYAADVKKFLLGVKRRRGYLVTGFLTTSRAVWGRAAGSGSENDVNLTVPTDLILEANGMPVPPGLTSPSFNVNWAEGENRQRWMVLGENEIVAVAYSHVKVSWKGKKIKLGGGVVARKSALAFGDKDNEKGDVDEPKGVSIADVDLSKFKVDFDNEDESDEDDEDDDDEDDDGEEEEEDDDEEEDEGSYIELDEDE